MGSRLSMLFAALGLALVTGCPGKSTGDRGEPAGTPTDPVEVCERAADVCRLDDSRLGVCTARTSGAAGFVCMSQH